MQGDVLHWRMTKKYFFPHHPLFKLRQTAPDQLLLHFPSAKRLNLYDMQLNYSGRFLPFSREMNAIEVARVGGSEWVFAGLKSGAVEGRPLQPEGEERSIELALQSEMGSNIFINDLLDLGEGRLMNCYNSGRVAIWDIREGEDKSAPLCLLKAHEDFLYKLRRVDEGKVVSCGNDHYAHIIDLQTFSISDSYYHPDSVWCSYPIDRNLICSAGLFGSLIFHDLRCRAIVQLLELHANETSFITHLDSSSLVFGDGRVVTRCDLRRMERERQCQDYGMNISAECILVTEEGGIAVGRGGDLCLFAKGGVQTPPEEKKLKYDHSPFAFLNIFSGLFAPGPVPAGEQQQWSDQSEEG